MANLLKRLLGREKTAEPLPSFPERIGAAAAIDTRRVHFAFATPYARQLVNLARVARRLEARGYDVTLVSCHEFTTRGDAAETLAREPLDAVGLRGFLAGERPPDVLVVMNDVGAVTSRLVELARRSDVVTVGLTNLVLNLAEGRDHYRKVDHVLAAGRYIEETLGRSGIRAVGFPELDELVTREPRFPDRPLVVLNSKTRGKHHGGRKRAVELRDEWLETTGRACRDLDVDLVVSRHPRDEGKLGRWPISRAPFKDLLARGTVAVSPPSGVLLEAMALGVPVVCHRALPLSPKESPSFDEPLGAFRVTTSGEEFRDALAEALTWVGDYRRRCGAFFGRHVAWDGVRSMTDVAADALIDLLPASRREPARPSAEES